MLKRKKEYALFEQHDNSGVNQKYARRLVSSPGKH